MGYTHYWYRPLKLSTAEMTAILNDFNRIVLALDDAGVKLADGLGEGLPELTAEVIRFNGPEHCGHERNAAVVIPWPAKHAGGVNTDGEKLAGSWFAGTMLTTRTCDGSCSYETFDFPKSMDPSEFLQPSREHGGLYFNCCKTAYRPYDVAVTALLIIAKHHLGKRIHVDSDGEDEQWRDAKRVCEACLGYGAEYQMDNNKGLFDPRHAAA